VAADNEIGREKSAQEKNQRRQNEPHCFGKKGMPALTGFYWA
jgi:hypothetical protein